MELAMSAVAGELASRFISFLANKYHSSHEATEQKVQRLQRLLTRVCTVVEEADARYIPNSGMLMQLETLSKAMYRGRRALDTFKHRALEVSHPSGLNFAVPLIKRSRTSACTRKEGLEELHDAVESLEIAVADMAEFVVLLGGCDQMSRRPYDAYLYIDNFMFARHAEKQRLLGFLQQNNTPDAPAVLPIIGGQTVGKKTLVAHVCNDERVRSRFTSVLHLNGDSLLSILDHERTMSGMMLVIVEFFSDTNDEEWKQFYSSITKISRESKVIIVSRHERLARFGSVKPILLKILCYEEFWYLFKTLAFGSADPAQHPQLVRIADEFNKELQSVGSLVAASAFADVLRRNLSVQFWLCILSRARKVIQRNKTMYGMPPNLLFREGHAVDITDFPLHSASQIRLIPCTSGSSSQTIDSLKKKTNTPMVTLGQLLVDPPTVMPKEEFSLLTWESRIPPYTTYARFVPSCAQDMPQGAPMSGRKRRGEPI